MVVVLYYVDELFVIVVIVEEGGVEVGWVSVDRIWLRVFNCWGVDDVVVCVFERFVFVFYIGVN